MDGKSFRLARLLRGGRLLCVPLDHGVTQGATGGLRKIQETLDATCRGGASAVVLHSGLVPWIGCPASMGLFVHLSGGTNLVGDTTRKSLVSSVERACRSGADGVSIHVNLGAPSEHRMLQDFGAVVDECARYGMPLMAMTYVRPRPDVNVIDPNQIAHAARLSAELGADIVKVSFPGSGTALRDVVASCPAPLVISGGEYHPHVLGPLRMAQDAVHAGAIGVSFGRNVFERPDVAGFVAALAQIVYRDVSAADAAAEYDASQKRSGENSED